MLNTKAACKVLTNIHDCKRLIMESFWEDDEDRLPDLPIQICDYELELFYDVLATLNVSVRDFCDELNAEHLRDYEVRDYGRIAVSVKDDFYCVVDENMLELLYSYVCHRAELED